MSCVGGSAIFGKAEKSMFKKEKGLSAVMSRVSFSVSAKWSSKSFGNDRLGVEVWSEGSLFDGITLGRLSWRFCWGVEVDCAL